MQVTRWGQIRQCSTFLFQLSYCKLMFFSPSIKCHVFHIFVLFFFRFCCLKWPPGVVLKCCLLFLSPIKLIYIREKIHVLISFIQAWVTVLLVTESKLMSQYKYKIRCVKAETCKQGYVCIGWWKQLVDEKEAWGILPCISPRIYVSIFTNSAFVKTL